MVEYINGKRVIEGYTEGARVYNNANISIENNTNTALTFNSERYDTDSIHNTSTNTSRLTCNTAGKYLIIGNVVWAASAGNLRFAWIVLGGTTYLVGDIRNGQVAGATYDEIVIATIYDLAVTNYVEFFVKQTSGGALNAFSAAAIGPEFMMHRIG